MPGRAGAGVLIAPDSFKGSLGADRVAAAIARGWHSVRPSDELVLRPMADGGEGTLAALKSAIPDSVLVPVTVPGPIGEPVFAHWLHLPDGNAVVELAETSGMLRLPRSKSGELILHPLEAHTRGVGEAIRAALAAGAKHVHVALGGSCSTDAGAGILVGLGARLLDVTGAGVPLGNRGLGDVAVIDIRGMAEIPNHSLTVWSDVAAPLLGPRGAVAQFGPQKGMTAELLPGAEARLAHIAQVFELDPMTPGFGAAGGATCALAWLGAEIVQGASAVAMLVGLAETMIDTDLVITGEGSFDAQSAEGKAPALIMELASRAHVPVALVAGRIDPRADTLPLAQAVSLTDIADRASGEDPMRDAETLLVRAGRSLAATTRVK